MPRQDDDEDRGQRGRRGRDGDGPPRGLLIGATAVLGLLAAILLFQIPVGQETLSSDELSRLLARGEVAQVIFRGENEATAVLRSGALRGDGPRERDVKLISKEHAVKLEGEIRDLISRKGIATRVTVRHENQLLAQLVAWTLPALVLLVTAYFLLFRPMRGGGGPGSVLSFGKSRHRVADKERTGVTLEDVAGCEEAKEEIQEIIEFLKNPKKFSRLGGRIPKGALLVGAPGTGKTLLAKAAAGEADVPFFAVCGSDFVEMFVGVGASRVRDLFEKARENSPCIIFLDEIDAVGRRRTASAVSGGHDEREQTLNQILVEMDGFDTERGILVIGATNRPDILDTALLRRFERQIVLDLPDVKGREAILRVHARNVKLAPEADLRTVAKATPMFSGAELASLINEAALSASLANRDGIAPEDLEEARDKVRWGRSKRSRVFTTEDRRATAYHEAGHALIASKLEGCDPLHKVTIIPRGIALGVTMALPEQDRYNLTRKQCLAQIAMCFGGRIGEETATNDVSTGAADDIDKATRLARRMVCEWGMSEELGPISFEDEDQGLDLARGRSVSEETARRIDAEVRKIVEGAYQRASEVIQRHRAALDAIAEALLRYETLTGDEVQALLDGRATPDRLRSEPDRARTQEAPASAPAPAQAPARAPDARPLADGPGPAPAVA